MTPDDPLRVGSDAPVTPGRRRCDARWPGPWEDRVEARPRCEREPGHASRHHVEQAGFDGRCFRYTWAEGEEPRAEPC